jgi:hypothetical protein
MIKRPNGTVYKEWYHLYSPAELQALKDKDNKEFGQISSHNLEGNAKSATGLAAATGAVAAGAYYNMSADRQSKLKRLVRGATLGKTRPQGVGVKTPTGSAGDVRGRVVPDRPPAIVRSAGSFNQRGSAMPQQGNLFNQPEPPSGKKKAPGRRYAPAGTAKSTGKGTRGVPRPAPRASGKAAGPAPKTPVTQARPTPLNPNRNTGPWRPTPVNPDYKVEGPKPAVDQRYRTTNPLKSGSMPYGSTGTPNIPSDYWTNPNRMNKGIPYNPSKNYGVTTTGGTPNWVRSLNPLQGEKSMLRPSPLNPDVPDAPSGGTQKSGTRYAPAGTAKATNKGTRGVPRPTPRSNFKPATGGAPVPEPSTKPTARTTPVQRGSAAPRTPSPSLPARNTSPATGKYSGRSTGVSTKPKTPGELKAIEDAMRARRAGTGGTSLSGQRTALRPTPLAPVRVPNSPEGPLTGQRTALRPTPLNPDFRPGPVGQLPNGPLNPVPGPLGRTAPKPGFFDKVNKFVGDLGKRGTGIKRVDTLFQAAGMIDKLGGEPYRQHMAAHPGDRNLTPMQLSEHMRTSKLEAPKAAAAPAQPGENKPAGGTSQKPSGPAYFPEAGRNGSAVRTPDSYLGEAFDYSLQKGTNSGTKYLEHMFRRDKISADDQQRLRERFNKKVVGDQTLKEYGADKGITQTLEGKKSGLGEALLGKYRDTGTYKGNTDYDVMRAAAEARLAKK